MSKYYFSLQSVLDWRSEQEDNAKLELVRIRNEYQKQSDYLQKLVNENIHLKEKITITNYIHTMQQEDLYKKVLEEKIIQQKLIVEQIANDVELAESQLLKAHQEKKVMERLKEKEFEQYEDGLRVEEQHQIDEYSTITYGREAFQ